MSLIIKTDQMSPDMLNNVLIDRFNDPLWKTILPGYIDNLIIPG